LAHADYEFKLPQYGITESMNVSVAGGVLMTYLDVYMQKMGREKFLLKKEERDALLLDWLDRHVNGIENNSPIVRIDE
jgi:tRNA (guanosine-2'-O-)-methyltransferase